MSAVHNPRRRRPLSAMQLHAGRWRRASRSRCVRRGGRQVTFCWVQFGRRCSGTEVGAKGRAA